MIDPGIKIKCFFRNGLVVEGVVHSWLQKLIMVSDIGNNLMVILKPEEDLIMFEVINEVPVEVPMPVPSEAIARPDLNVEFNAKAAEPPSDLRNKNLAQLKKMMIEQEKKIVSEKVRSHTIEQVNQVQYGNPKF